MPRWMKIAVTIVGVGLFLLMAAGVVAARALKKGAAEFEQTMNQASEEGTRFGSMSTLDGCVAEVATRSGACREMSLTCMPGVTAFLWGCLEAAPYDVAFCREVPAAGNDQAVMAWGQRTCSRHGRPHDDLCQLAVSVVAGFCDSKKR